MTQNGWRIVAVVAAILFAWLVWPTEYRYDHETRGAGTNSTTIPVRINRFTGAAEILGPRGWVRPASARNQDTGTALTDDDVAKLTGTAQIRDYGEIDANIYNGTNKLVTSITVSVTLKDANGVEQFTRLYKLISPLGGGPLQASTYMTDVGFTPSSGQTWSWKIVSAIGATAQ